MRHKAPNSLSPTSLQTASPSSARMMARSSLPTRHPSSAALARALARIDGAMSSLEMSPSQPRMSLAPVTSGEPKPVEGRESHTFPATSGLGHGPFIGRPQIVVLHLQAVQPNSQPQSTQLRFSPLGQRHEPVPVPPPHLRRFPRALQLVSTVQPDGLQEPVSRLPAVCLGDDERFVHQL